LTFKTKLWFLQPVDLIKVINVDVQVRDIRLAPLMLGMLGEVFVDHLVPSKVY
jgi:hypothetical protein